MGTVLAGRLFGPKGMVNMEEIFTAGLNLRLNLSCTSLDCVSVYLNTLEPPGTLATATAVHEMDTWRYGGNTSMTCSMFAFQVRDTAPAARMQACCWRGL